MHSGLAVGILILCVQSAASMQAQNVPVNAALASAVEAGPFVAGGSATDGDVVGFFHGMATHFHRPSLSGNPTYASKVDVFVADSRWYPYGTVNHTNFFPLKDGILASATYYKDKNVGFELQGNYQVTSSTEGSKGGAIGPVYRFMVPYVYPTIHLLVGSQYFLGPLVPSYGGTGFYANPPEWATTVSVGGSGDIPVPKTHGHLAIRVKVSYEYLHSSNGPVYSPSQGGQVNINSYLLNPGLVVKFGHAKSGSYTPKKAKR
jgi:hypothetical protein